MKLIGDGGHAAVVRTLTEWRGGMIIAIGNNGNRKHEAERHEGAKFGLAVGVNAACFAASVGEGTVVMAGSVIQARAVIGRHVIINTAATLDHDVVVGDYAHIAPGCHLCGNVTVGEGALLGVGTVVIPGIKIGAWAVVGAGSVVIRDVPDGAKVAGNPARAI